ACARARKAGDLSDSDELNRLEKAGSCDPAGADAGRRIRELCWMSGVPSSHWNFTLQPRDRNPRNLRTVNSDAPSGSSVFAGLVARKYAHPFIEERDGVTWAFQHNGSLVNDPEEPGLLDSQVLFHSLLGRLTSRTHEGLGEATTAVRDMAIDKYGGFTGLNFMLSDGDSLHGYRDFQTNGQYYTLYIDNLGEMVIAASEPILAMTAEPIPRGVLPTVQTNLDVQRTTIS